MYKTVYSLDRVYERMRFQSIRARLDGVQNIRFLRSDFLKLPLEDHSLDLIALNGVLEWVGMSDTSLDPRREGPHPAADLGTGMRFYPADWMALELGFTATLYPDRPTPTSPSTTSRILAAHLGVTFFYPFGFEYVYP